MLKIGVISLGCPKNLVDTEKILGDITKSGYKITNNPTEADVIIINTCTFINKAKQESINAILEMAEFKTKGNCKLLIVIGCMAKRYKKEIQKEIPEVDVVISFEQYNDIVSIIEKALGLKSKLLLNSHNKFNRIITTPFYTAYLKIADGCNNKCSYCVIPSIRGTYKSREFEDIINEANYLAHQGVKELIVVAQDTTCYGMDLYGKPLLPKLIRRLCEIEGIQWIRILYTYPSDMINELIEVIATEEKVCKYIDIPIQHISDKILKLMGRKTTSSKIKEIIKKLRTQIPNIVIRTSVIVGFPGETDEDFSELLNFIQESKFEKLGVFTYSREEGTPAATLPNQVPYKIKKFRESTLLKLQKNISQILNSNLIGYKLKALVEGNLQNNQYWGRTYRDSPDIDGIIYIKSDKKLEVGSFVDVIVDDYNTYDLYGEVCYESCK